MKLSNVRVVGHRGTWYELSRVVIGEDIRILMEHEQYGQDTAALIIDENCNVILDDVHNGWDDYNDAFDVEVTPMGWDVIES